MNAESLIAIAISFLRLIVELLRLKRSHRDDDEDD